MSLPRARRCPQCRMALFRDTARHGPRISGAIPGCRTTRSRRACGLPRQWLPLPDRPCCTTSDRHVHRPSRCPATARTDRRVPAGSGMSLEQGIRPLLGLRPHGVLGRSRHAWGVAVDRVQLLAVLAVPRVHLREGDPGACFETRDRPPGAVVRWRVRGKPVAAAGVEQGVQVGEVAVHRETGHARFLRHGRDRGVRGPTVVCRRTAASVMRSRV